jgi:hypothetical protein
VAARLLFIHVKSNRQTFKEKTVTSKMLHLVSDHIDRRTLGHAIMSFYIGKPMETTHSRNMGVWKEKLMKF